MIPPSPSPSLRGGGTEMGAAQRALAPGRERASEMQDGLGSPGVCGPAHPTLGSSLLALLQTRWA